MARKDHAYNGWGIADQTVLDRSLVKQHRKTSTTNPQQLVWKTVVSDFIFLFFDALQCEADQSGCLCFQILWTALQTWATTISSVACWNQPKEGSAGRGPDPKDTKGKWGLLTNECSTAPEEPKAMLLYSGEFSIRPRHFLKFFQISVTKPPAP